MKKLNLQLVIQQVEFFCNKYKICIYFLFAKEYIINIKNIKSLSEDEIIKLNVEFLVVIDKHEKLGF